MKRWSNIMKIVSDVAAEIFGEERLMEVESGESPLTVLMIVTFPPQNLPLLPVALLALSKRLEDKGVRNTILQADVALIGLIENPDGLGAVRIILQIGTTDKGVADYN